MKKLLLGLSLLTSIPSFACTSLDIGKRADKTVWASLMVLDQISESSSFTRSGDKILGNMTALSGKHTGEVVMFGSQLDQIFVNIRGANRNVEEASIKLIEAIESNKNMTVCDLAKIADQLYTFHGE